MIHNAILDLYSNACTVNGDTKETISVKDTDGNEVSINWTNVETRAKELEAKLDQDKKDQSSNKTTAISKLKTLGLTDDEISALIAN